LGGSAYTLTTKIFEHSSKAAKDNLVCFLNQQPENNTDEAEHKT